MDYSGLMFLLMGNKEVCECNTTNIKKDIGKLSTTSHEHILQQSKNTKVNKWWALLDKQSTVDVFANGKLLKNIHRIRRPLKISSTGRVTSTNLIGYLPGYGWVWYYPDSIANILSLAPVKRKFCVTFDSKGDNQFHVHL